MSKQRSCFRLEDLKINKEKFKRMFLDYNIDVKDIAEYFGVGKDSVYKIARKLDLFNRQWKCPYCNRVFKGRVYWCSHCRIHEQIPYDKLKSLIDEGLTLQEISSYFGVKKSKIESTIRTVYRISLNRRGQLDKYKDKIISLYKKGYSVNWIAKKFGVSDSSLRYNLEHWGIELRSLQEQFEVLPDEVKKVAEERRKRTCIKRYGVPNPSMIEEVKEVISKTSSERVNSQNALKIPLRRYKHLLYQGNYEFYFIQKLEKENLIDFLSNFKGSIRYFNPLIESYRWYHPDFIIEDLMLVTEVKSSYVLEYQGGEEVLKAKFEALEELGYKPILVLDNDDEKIDEIINYCKKKFELRRK